MDKPYTIVAQWALDVEYLLMCVGVTALVLLGVGFAVKATCLKLKPRIEGRAKMNLRPLQGIPKWPLIKELIDKREKILKEMSTLDRLLRDYRITREEYAVYAEKYKSELQKIDDEIAKMKDELVRDLSEKLRELTARRDELAAKLKSIRERMREASLREREELMIYELELTEKVSLIEHDFDSVRKVLEYLESIG